MHLKRQKVNCFKIVNFWSRINSLKLVAGFLLFFLNLFFVVFSEQGSPIFEIASGFWRQNYENWCVWQGCAEYAGMPVFRKRCTGVVKNQLSSSNTEVMHPSGWCLAYQSQCRAPAIIHHPWRSSLHQNYTPLDSVPAKLFFLAVTISVFPPPPAVRVGGVPRVQRREDS